MNAKVSDNGLKFIKKEEGCRYRAYKDVGGKYTIGTGHLIKKGEERLLNDVLTDQKVLDLLRTDIKVTENAINLDVKKPINQNQVDALGSFIFNCGDGAFGTSSLLRKINTNPNDKTAINVHDIVDTSLAWMKAHFILRGITSVNTIQYSFAVYHKVNKVPNLDLFERRLREYELYSK